MQNDIDEASVVNQLGPAVTCRYAATYGFNASAIDTLLGNGRLFRHRGIRTHIVGHCIGPGCRLVVPIILRIMRRFAHGRAPAKKGSP